VINAYWLQRAVKMMFSPLFERGDPLSMARAANIKADFLNNRVYGGGLKVKEVPISDNRTTFVGARVQIGERSMYCASTNRNWPTLESNIQLYPRFHRWSSYADQRAKRGVVIGALQRIQRQCTYEANTVLEAIKLKHELDSLGYPDTVFNKAVRTLADRDKGTLDGNEYLKGTWERLQDTIKIMMMAFKLNRQKLAMNA
jgi:hypothetical protein